MTENKRVILFLFFFVFGLSLYANTAYFFCRTDPALLRFFPPFIAGINKNFNSHLGAEYYFIAEALTSGKGFSNPFQAETGPTAWMPPLYSLLLSFFIKIFTFKRTVAIFVILLKNIILFLTGLFVYEIAKRTTISIKPRFILLFYLFFLVFYFRWFFQFSHDEWFLLALVCITLAFVFYINNHQPMQKKDAIIWGLIGSFNLLSSPALGLAWISISILFLINDNLISRKYSIISLSVCFLFFMPWMIRNYIVFNRIIPIKSNFFWDAYSINYNTQDGINTEDFLIKNHPYFTVRLGTDLLYKNIGENAFMAIYREKFFAKLHDDPIKLLNNIKNRFFAIFLIYYPYHRYETKAFWKNIIHSIPFVSIILLIIILFKYNNIQFIYYCFIIYYFVYLFPYLIISYYMRYDIPLIPLKVFFIFWALDIIFSKTRWCKKIS